MISLALLAFSIPGLGSPQSATSYKPKPGEEVLELRIESEGLVDILLHTKEAPKAVAHIEALVEKGFYDRQRVFKIIDEPKPYLVQMGDPASKDSLSSPALGSGSTGQPVPYEDTQFPTNEGAVVLATKSGDRDSGDCQFFILLGDYTNLLSGSGTVFGKVVSSMTLVHHLKVGDEILSAKIIKG